MRSFVLLATTITVGLSFIHASIAQVDAEVLMDRSTLLTFSGDTDTDPNAVAALSDGSSAFMFETENGATGEDSVLSFSPLAIHASEAAIELAIGVAPGTGIAVTELTSDSSGTLYMVVRSSSVDHLARIASAGTVQRMVAGGGAQGADRIAVDSANSRLVVMLGFGAATPGLYTVGLAANDGALTLLSASDDFDDFTTPANAGSGSVNDIAVRSNGDVLVIFVNSDFPGGYDGDIVRVSSAGVASTFADGSLALIALGAPGGDYLDPYLEVLSDDQVLVVKLDSAPEAIARSSADGTTWTAVADMATLLADTDLIAASITDIGMVDTAIDGTDRLYLANSRTNSESILRLSGSLVPIELSSFDVD